MGASSYKLASSIGPTRDRITVTEIAWVGNSIFKTQKFTIPILDTTLSDPAFPPPIVPPTVITGDPSPTTTPITKDPSGSIPTGTLQTLSPSPTSTITPENTTSSGRLSAGHVAVVVSIMLIVLLAIAAALYILWRRAGRDARYSNLAPNGVNTVVGIYRQTVTSTYFGGSYTLTWVKYETTTRYLVPPDYIQTRPPPPPPPRRPPTATSTLSEEYIIPILSSDPVTTDSPKDAVTNQPTTSQPVFQTSTTNPPSATSNNLSPNGLNAGYTAMVVFIVLIVVLAVSTALYIFWRRAGRGSYWRYRYVYMCRRRISSAGVE
ncbi:hypothetical protein AJ80_07315 [Polytolypa hystricis UAMH7299]|uniref:Mid2 domain-containing protein n=1 Tax=Polytolypa hystricis (strain UAMH7299) TaxID=1447883 RepID=A0A2B7XQS6_POLH7|nr:hypothetical protein AJ80_07315 [Polytolypa hystricis UAMH7299]